MKDCDKVEYCAMNVLGYAYGDTLEKARALLLEHTVGRDGKHPNGLLREFRFKVGCRPDRWTYYCPEWVGGRCKGERYALVADNMKDWPESTQWPIELEV